MNATASPERLGTLYVIPSLLGLVPPTQVLPQQTIDVACRLSHFVVETPKIARQFLKALDPQRSLSSIAMAELNEHTAAERVPELLVPALQGYDLGLLTDAGCPCLADPGNGERRRPDLGLDPLVLVRSDTGRIGDDRGKRSACGEAGGEGKGE